MSLGEHDNILAPDYLGDLGARSNAELRHMRAECEEAEEGVSYARRLLQGRLDILRAELLRRDEAGDVDAAELLASLPGILGTDRSHSGPTQARSTRLRVPASAEGHEARIDELVGNVDLDDLDGHDVDQLRELSDRLAAYERELSALRHELFVRIDALRDELAERYRDGRADVSQLLAES